MKNFNLHIQMEKEFEWRKWAKEIPFIKFPADWEIAIIPPFTGAIVRFLVNTPLRKGVSIYLDCYGMLGACYEPYWEVYPDKEGDNSRFKINDIEGLLKCIEGIE